MLNKLPIQNIELVLFATVFLFCFAFFFVDTFLFWQCFFAAMIATALFAVAYYMLKWFYLALK